jgi:cobalt-zinc-cadmium resistance protein CzcA
MDENFRDALPDVSFGCSQYIEDNVDEALSGVTAANSIKVSARTWGSTRTLPVASWLSSKRFRCITGPAQLACQTRPDRCSRYGINVGDVGAVVQAAIGGQAATQFLEGDRRFDLVVRWLPEYRESLNAIRQIRVSTPACTSIPLSLVSDLKTAEGASFIYREQLARNVPLRFAVRGRDLESAVREAKERVARGVKLPEGVHLEWAGEYGDLRQAIQRLEIIVPFSFVLIAAVLYGAIPGSTHSSSWLRCLWLASDESWRFWSPAYRSVCQQRSASSIFGIAVMDGILLSTYIRQLWDQRHPFVESIIMGSDRRLRP